MVLVLATFQVVAKLCYHGGLHAPVFRLLEDVVARRSLVQRVDGLVGESEPSFQKLQVDAPVVLSA